MLYKVVFGIDDVTMRSLKTTLESRGGSKRPISNVEGRSNSANDDEISKGEWAEMKTQRTVEKRKGMREQSIEK